MASRSASKSKTVKTRSAKKATQGGVAKKASGSTARTKAAKRGVTKTTSKGAARKKAAKRAVTGTTVASTAGKKSATSRAGKTTTTSTRKKTAASKTGKTTATSTRKQSAASKTGKTTATGTAGKKAAASTAGKKAAASTAGKHASSDAAAPPKARTAKGAATPAGAPAWYEVFSAKKLDGRTLSVASAGALRLTTGELVGADPLRIAPRRAFERRVPKGTYDVKLAVSAGQGGKRIAAAILCVSDEAPVKWEPATFQGKKPKPGAVPAYGVDCGTGSFMDAEAARKLTAEQERALEADDFEGGPTTVALTARRLSAPHNGASIDLEGTDANIVAFASGWGDGAYVSYWGLDKSGKVACLVTDFEVHPPQSGPSALTS